ncbi:MAG: hypothetical protein QOK36_778 [Gaiellales bacterium]|nr:hypothetical protein [Gaiellales bacterium]
MARARCRPLHGAVHGNHVVTGARRRKPLRSGDTSSSTQAPWILGKKVMLPAGVIQRIDGEAEKVYVHRTKDQIKNAPEYDDTMASDEGYRGELGSYYGSSGPGYRDWDQSL